MSSGENSNAKSSAYLLLVVLAVIWGSSFILMKRGLVIYTPLQIGCLRMLCAALVMTPFLLKGFKTVQPHQWKYLLATGMFGNAIPSVLFPLAETGISSSLAGMINTLTPIFTLLLGAFAFGMTVARNRLAGLLIGLVGAVLLISGGNGKMEASGPVFPFYVVCATMCYAISVNVLRHKLSELHPLTITSFALLFIGVPMGGWLFTTDFIQRTLDHLQDLPDVDVFGSGLSATTRSFGSVFLLGVFGTALSTVMFNKLIQSSGALVASSVTYLIPVVATLWGVIDGESIGWMHLSGLCLILSGVYLVNMKR